MGYKIAFDPGLNATGYAVFHLGKPVKIGTLRPGSKATTPYDKMRVLKGKLQELMEKYNEDRFALSAVAVEAWQVHWTAKKRPQSLESMSICNDVRGLIITVALDFQCEISKVNKGFAKKDEADWLAKSFKLTGSKDAKDALHLGVLAGFDL